MKITDIVQSSGWKNFMAKLYGLGAAVVIIGALFKIQHWPGAGIMLTIGLTTEAVIFFFSAFEPLHEELDWTLVYPELAGMTDPDELESPDDTNPALKNRGLLERFDEIVGEANITPEAFSTLGDNLSKLNHTAGKMADLNEASTAATNYVDNFKNAAETLHNMTNTYSESTRGLQDSVSKLSSSYSQSAESVMRSSAEISSQVEQSGESLKGSYQKLAESIDQQFNSISNGGQSYGNQLETLNKNLSALNAVYELQLQGTNEYLKENQKLYGGFNSMLSNLNESVEETKRYKEEISKLGENLASLNSVYGNMLTAMNVKK